MTPETICRVWYGKRLGIPQSFIDIGNFYGAAKFATLMMADRIEVIREPLTTAFAMERTTAVPEPCSSL